METKKKRPRYAVTYGNIVNCPSCDTAYGAFLDFYRTLKDIMRVVKANRNEREYRDIYDLSAGEVIGEIGYSYSRHSVSEIQVNFYKPVRIRYITADDGHGNQIWKVRA